MLRRTAGKERAILPSGVPLRPPVPDIIAAPRYRQTTATGTAAAYFCMFPVSAGLRRRHMLAQSPPARAGIGSLCFAARIFFSVSRAVPPRASLCLVGSAAAFAPPPPVLRLLYFPTPPTLRYLSIVQQCLLPPFSGARIAHDIPTVKGKMHG